MAYRPEYTKALELIGRAFNEVVANGHPRPVIVGGAAVEYYTGGAMVSGDFDVVTTASSALDVALKNQGFRPEDRSGHLLRGYYHPESAIGVEIVANTLFEGNADASRISTVQITEASGVGMVSVEDLIADRMGQYCSTPTRIGLMLEQAIRLYEFAQGLDESYLNARIRKETLGNCDLRYLQVKARER